MGKQSKLKKDRRCSSCGQTITMTAKQIKAHYIGCKKHGRRSAPVQGRTK